MWYRKWLFLNSLFYKNKANSRDRELKKRATKYLRKYLALESLEDRVVPATITWNNPSGGAWDVGTNWVGNVAPGSGDTALIDTTGAATITITSSDNIQVQGVSTNSNATLAIAGSLTVTSGASTLSGAFTMTEGTLEVNGATATLTANGTTTIANANLYAEGGGTLALPNLTTYSENTGTNFEATGSNSVINVSGLTSLGSSNAWDVTASTGGMVNLSALSSIDQPNNGIRFDADGSGSLLNLSALTSFTGNATFSSFTITNHATVDDSLLTSFTGENITLDGTGSIATSQWATLNGGGSLTVTGGDPTFTSLTDVDGSSLYAQGGGTLALPNLTSYANLAFNPVLQASGAGSVLNLSALDDFNAPSNEFFVYALSGGAVNLSAVTAIDLPNTGVNFKADGSGSQLNLSSLTSITCDSTFSSFTDTNGATVQASSLTSFTGDNITLDGTIATSQWAHLNGGGSLTVTGGDPTFTSLTDVNGSSLYAQSGGTLAIPNLTSYNDQDVYNATFQASGAGSVLNLSALDNFTSTSDALFISALSGGSINLSAVTAIDQINASYIIKADGSGSQLNLSSLTSITCDSTFSSFTVTNRATVLASSLTSFTGDNITLDGTGTIATSQWAHLNGGGSLTVTGGDPTFTSLTDVNGSSLYAQSGGTLAIPNLTSYNDQDVYNATFQASGAGSVLNLSALDNFTSTSDALFISALSGGSINLSAVTAIDQINASYIIKADGSGSQLNLSALASIVDNSTFSSLTVTNSGTILVSPNLTSLNGMTVNLDGSDAAFVADWTTFSNGTINLSGGTETLPSLTTFTGSSFNLSNGAALILPVLQSGNIALSNNTSVSIRGTLVDWPAAGTIGTVVNVPASSGLTITFVNSGTLTDPRFNVGAGTNIALSNGTYLGADFNVGMGATVDLTDEGNVSYGGILTGSGSGTVEFNGNGIYPVLGGVTLDFPGNLFQWTNGGFFAALGDVTNLGTVNLVGPNDKGMYEDSTFYNYGKIVQTGTGNIDLHSDSVTPTVLMNEAGATYLIESDGGIDNYNGGTTALVNDGTIRKTAGTGTSTLDINGSLSNTGTIEVDSGTLYLDATTIAQVSISALTGGTWNALNGATLQFPGTIITDNEGNITLSGNGSFTYFDNPIDNALGALSTNSGSLTVESGEMNVNSFFTNSGTLTLGGTLKVGSNLDLTATSVINEEIGGTASGEYGQLVTPDDALLGGAFNLAFVNGFTPSAGENFFALSYTLYVGDYFSYLDLGADFSGELLGSGYELTSSVANPTNLAVTSVTAPTAATGGQDITVNWEVTNEGSNTAAGNWLDSVYLSTTTTISSSSILLGSVSFLQSAPHDVEGLGANGSYESSLTAALPALPPGNYYVLVESDSLYQQNDSNRANGTMAATTGQLAVTVPSLTIGSPTNGSFTAAGQGQYYQVAVPAGGSLSIALASTASTGELALYVSPFTAPTAYNCQYASNTTNQPNQTVIVPQVAAPTTYYILVQSLSGAAATAGFSLTATQTSAVAVIAPSTAYSGGNGGNLTIPIIGTNFEPDTTATLTLISNTPLDATSIYYVNAGEIYATFDLSGQPIGNYTLKVTTDSQTVIAPTPVQVVEAGTGSLDVSLGVPQYVRSGRTGTIVITYSNPTNNDMVAPLLDIESTTSSLSFSTPDDPNDYTQDAEVLAVAPNGPAGILRPGQSGELTLTILDDDTIDNDSIPISVGQMGSGVTIDWAAQESILQPPGVPTAAWDITFTNLEAMVGSTTDSYNAALAQAATYLSSAAESATEVSDISLLWSFLISQADAAFPTKPLTAAEDASQPIPGSLTLAIDRTFPSSITSRDTPGIFGLGWATSWQASLSVDPSGNVTISSGTSVSFFERQENGSYTATDGESGTLTLSGGVYTFTDSSGTQNVFLGDGFLDYAQDTNGNRITLGYSENQLVSLTYSNASDSSEPTEQLALSYNAQGFVSQVADGTGDVWSYSYDAAGHLLSVTAPGNLTTSYTYDTGSNFETANALLSITNPDGSQQNFAYDPNSGRLTGTSQNAGADPIAYTYPGEGEVVATDANGNQTTVWFNDMGLPGRVESPLGGISTYDYDDTGNLVDYTDAGGNEYQYSYDANGNLTQVINPLGQTVSMSYGSLSTLTSLTDADGNTTQYSYDSSGNLLSITYPDGTSQSFTYNPLGDATEMVEQNGDPVFEQYNAQGLVSEESFADGSSQTDTYDAHGNLLTANAYDSSGTLTGTTTLTYNAANELTLISYPGGLSLTFTYNARGQRIQSVDQSGYTIDYSYDALGRLSELTDGSGNLIVRYTYNNLGELAEKQNGNGTYTTYAYDADRNLKNEINYANAGGTTVNSSFTDTYNTLDEETSMTDNAGNTTTYSYDPTGQLTEVTLPDGSTIQYVYNAAGDRTEVINNGTATNSASNADNEITQVGSSTYTYDANGNLATVTDSSGTTTYTYNDLNELVSIANPDGSVQSFQYSPLGFMIGTSTASGGSTSQTNYLVDPTGLGNVVAAYNGNGSLIADYNYGLGLVSQTGPNGAGYYDFDAAGNTVGITGSSGTYVNRYSYLPFGETTTIQAALPNPFTFAGQFGVMQTGGGLLLMRARAYAPALGQFVSNDPTGLAGGDTNLRRYVQNTPLQSIDPTGQSDFNVAALQQAFNLTAQEVADLESAVLRANNLFDAAGNRAEAVKLTGLIGDSNNAIANLEYRLLKLEANLTAFNKVAQSLQVAKFLGRLYGFLGTLRILSQIPRASKLAYSLGQHFQPQNLGKFGQALLKNLISHDPNALIGPTGYGTSGFIADSGSLPYTAEFENDGTAAAQEVTVTEQLAPNLDWSTLQFGSFGFGPIKVTVPAGLTQYQTTVSYENVDGSPLNVLVSLDFNVATGLLTATFTSLDPTTGEAPAGVFDGFLPPNNASNVGEGYVQYTVQPLANLPTDAAIDQQASVVFDTNAAIATNTAINTIADIVNQTSISESAGTTAPSAEKISTRLGTNYSDPDKNTKPGIAVIGEDGTGTWQYLSGSTWVNIATVSPSSALLLPQADQLRFLPEGLASGSAELFYVAWDGSLGSAGQYLNAEVEGTGSPFSSEAGTFTVNLNAVTQAPVWLATSATLTPVLPGTTNPAGETVEQAFGSDFSGDNGQSAGIAVTGLTGTTDGNWQYALYNAGTQTYGNWIAIPATASASKALMLGASDLIRFVPTKVGFAGAVTLIAHAWDGSSGTDGGTVSLSKSGTTGGKTAYSSGTLTASLHVNTAPTQNSTGVTLTPALRENTTSTSFSVATLVKDSVASDANKGTSLGLALVGASGPGIWQYKLTSTWLAVPTTLASTEALLLSPSAALRFVPAPNQAGTASITWVAWDQSAGSSGQTNVNSTTGGSAGAFSTSSATATLAMFAETAIPIWSAGTPLLTPVAPNSTNPPGNTVATIFGAYYNDPTSTVGIAISAVTGGSDGTWQYSTDGVHWTNLPAVSASKTLNLTGSDYLRFVPKTGFLGTVTLTAHAWNGGTEFSTTTLNATCLINTSPTLNL